MKPEEWIVNPSFGLTVFDSPEYKEAEFLISASPDEIRLFVENKKREAFEALSDFEFQSTNSFPYFG